MPLALKMTVLVYVYYNPHLVRPIMKMMEMEIAFWFLMIKKSHKCNRMNLEIFSNVIPSALHVITPENVKFAESVTL